MKSLRAPWKCRAMETVENQRQVSHCSHSAWKSLSRFPHSHRAGGAWKSAKPKPGFALSHLLSCFLSSHTGSALCDHAIQMGLLAAISVTHVAGLKCYPCPRPYMYGFPELTRLGAALEQSAKQEDSSALHIQITKLSNYVERVQLIAKT